MIDNKDKLDYLGITKFHEAGYTGQDITITSREGTQSTHGFKVAEILSIVAPDSQKLLHINYTKLPETDIYTTSMFSASDGYAKNYEKAKKLNDKNVFLCCAVGNYSNERQTELSKFSWWNAIGACTLNNNIPQRIYYSSVTPDLDFMSITNFNTSKGMFTGTSCATPVFAGMCALVQSFFKINCGRKLTNKELLAFIRDNLQDLDQEGFDEKTGNGLFILPDPTTIDINKYLIEGDNEMKRKNIKLTIGKKDFSVNGETKIMDVEPFIQDNRTFVPIRFISEALGYDVIWNNDTKEIEIK